MKNAIKFVAAGAVLARSAAVFAHEGHGQTGIHWHATDTWGLVIITVLAAAALWVGRK
jgi:hypothetical protein